MTSSVNSRDYGAGAVEELPTVTVIHDVDGDKYPKRGIEHRRGRPPPPCAAGSLRL
jgi:hypothetical protein